MSASTMGPVKAALVARIAASVGTDVQVVYGPRPAGPTLGQIVAVGNISFASVPGPFGDGEPEDETYEVAVVCEVTIATGTQQQATEAALALHSMVKTALRPAGGDETLGVPGVLWARPTGPGQVLESNDPKVSAVGSSTAVPFVVQVMAVI